MGLKRITTVLGTGLAALAAVVSTASPSAAVGKDGNVEPGELGLYFLSGFRPPIFDLFLSDSNFADDVFPGTFIPADNNTESVWNRDVFYWYVYTGPNFTGSVGCLPPGVFGDFNITFKNTVSSALFSSTPC